MSENPIPLSQWQAEGNTYPTQNGWYNMLRPGAMRDELIDAGVVTRVNGRYLIIPTNWRTYCANRMRNPSLSAAKRGFKEPSPVEDPSQGSI